MTLSSGSAIYTKHKTQIKLAIEAPAEVSVARAELLGELEYE